jgi:excisionase family DNA binding protein
MPDTNTLLTVREAAERLRVNPESIRRWLRSGQLVGVHLGSDRGGWRISERDLDAFIQDRTRTPQENKR